MTPIDLAFGLLAGFLSCLTPASLLLLPILLCAIAARERPLTVAIGLGIALVATSAAAVALERYLGVDAAPLERRAVGLVLIAFGLLLNVRSLTNRFSGLTGGAGGDFDEMPPTRAGTVFRQLLLALFVGANWLPLPPPPILSRASMMAASGQKLPLALGTIFVFGLGAAMPWIILGRLLRRFPGVRSSRLVRGMMGKRLFGLVLILVAVAGLTGFDTVLAARLDPLLPHWMGKLAEMF